MTRDRPFRADPGRALARALAAVFGAPVTQLSEVGWASLTLDGHQHRLLVEGVRSLDAIDTLPEAEFAIPGHIVASAVVSRSVDSGGRTDLLVDALTIEAA